MIMVKARNIIGITITDTVIITAMTMEGAIVTEVVTAHTSISVNRAN